MQNDGDCEESPKKKKRKLKKKTLECIIHKDGAVGNVAPFSKKAWTVRFDFLFVFLLIYEYLILIIILNQYS